jgi:hypothetical protein
MVLFNKLEIHKNDIHVHNLWFNVDELLESCNIKSYLYKGQDNHHKLHGPQFGNNS